MWYIIGKTKTTVGFKIQIGLKKSHFCSVYEGATKFFVAWRWRGITFSRHPPPMPRPSVAWRVASNMPRATPMPCGVRLVADTPTKYRYETSILKHEPQARASIPVKQRYFVSRNRRKFKKRCNKTFIPIQNSNFHYLISLRADHNFNIRRETETREGNYYFGAG